jgi:hypothetical protein
MLRTARLRASSPRNRMGCEHRSANHTLGHRKHARNRRSENGGGGDQRILASHTDPVGQGERQGLERLRQSAF